MQEVMRVIKLHNMPYDAMYCAIYDTNMSCDCAMFHVYGSCSMSPTWNFKEQLRYEDVTRSRSEPRRVSATNG